MAARTIVFDLDDTLLDERPGRRAGRAAMERAVREALPGLAVSQLNAVYERQRSWFWEDAERHRRGRLDLLSARFEVLRRTLEEIGMGDEALARHGARRFVEAHERAMVMMPEARRVLRRVREGGARMVLLTNGAAEPQSRKIERFGLRGWFDHVQIEGAHGMGKPEPSAYLDAVAAVGGDPARATMVGNDFHYDVVGALRAGLSAVWIDLERRGRAPASAPRPHRTITALGELPRLLKSA